MTVQKLHALACPASVTHPTYHPPPPRVAMVHGSDAQPLLTQANRFEEIGPPGHSSLVGVLEIRA